jgi:diguanylate cyclase (GGDEF)-like protein
MNPVDIENDIVTHIQESIGDYTKLISSLQILDESYPEYPVFKLFFYKTSKLNLNNNEAKYLFENIVKHCRFLSSNLDKNINFYVGMLDYIMERNRIIMNPVFIDLFMAEKLDKTNYKDPLTGTFNNVYFPKLIKSEINRANRKKSFFSLMIIDIDKFSLINDNYGYNVGNYVLIELTDRIKQTIRAEDTLVRYCDDRFIVVLPNTNAKGAVVLAERIMSGLMKNLIRIENRILNLSISVGIAEYPLHCSNPDEILNILNKMRYLAKENGGNYIACPKE